MDLDKVPKRTNLWLDPKGKVETPWYLFDSVTVVFAALVGLFSAVIYWPSVSKFNFEEVFFTPLVPALGQFFRLFGLSFNDSLKFIYTFSFGLSTVAIYLLVRDMTKRQITPILASVIFLIPALPVFFLTNVFTGKNSELYISAYSFFSIVYGDGAIFLSLALIPLILIFFNRYLLHATFYYFAPTVILCALVLLASRTQSLNLLFILAVVAVNSFLTGMARRKMRRFFFIVLFSVGLVGFWYTPSFWVQTMLLKQTIIPNLRYIFPLPIILGSIGLVFSFVFFGRHIERRLIFIAFLILTIFSGVVFTWLVSGKSFIPYPYRLIPIISLFGSIVCAMAITAFADKIKLVSKMEKKFSTPLLALSGPFLFAAASFVFLGLIAFLFSPFVIAMLSGDPSPWLRIKSEVLLEKQLSLNIAGGNFLLVFSGAGDWQVMLGTIITIFFLLWLLFLIFLEIFGKD